MTTTPALTGRDIGEAQNAAGALLDRVLDQAGLSFDQWTVLLMLDGGGPLPRAELVRRQADGRKVPEASVQTTLDAMLSSGLLAPAGGSDERDDPRLAPTAAAEAVFRPARQAVAALTVELYGDLPPADLEATRRTLAEITRRANLRLAAG